MSATAMDETWTVARVLRWAQDDLRARGSGSPRLDAELLLSRVTGLDRLQLVLQADRPLEKAELSGYRELHSRRRRGEPVAYLLGEREFYSRRFVVDGRVLVPRPETELLVEVAMRRTRRLDLCARVLDLCTGSGCVAITLKKERPTTRVAASDVSPGALEVASLNARRLGASLTLVESDLFERLGALRGQLDLITANPPYVSSTDFADLAVDIRAFEPELALRAGDDGLALLRRVVAEAPAMLAAGGVLAVEVGAGQAQSVRVLFEEARFEEIRADRDHAGHERVVSGVVGVATL